MPANASTSTSKPRPTTLNDGFSPGQAIVVRIPGIDTAGAVAPRARCRSTTSAATREANTPDRRDRRADRQALADLGRDRLERVDAGRDRAARSTRRSTSPPGHRYIVALRNLKDAAGKTIEAPEGFRYYRDDLPSERAAINKQRDALRRIFTTLRGRASSATTSTSPGTSRSPATRTSPPRMLHIRDDAFAQLGDTTSPTAWSRAPRRRSRSESLTTQPQARRIARRVRGHLHGALLPDPDCAAGRAPQLDSNGAAEQNGTWTANFDCIIPRRRPMTARRAPGASAVYGHGLFGERRGGDFGAAAASSRRHTTSSTAPPTRSDVRGDVPDAIAHPATSRTFPAAGRPPPAGPAERALPRARLMISHGRLRHGRPLPRRGRDTRQRPGDRHLELYYNGNSQGGIMGGALTAVSPDFTRAALDVPGDELLGAADPLGRLRRLHAFLTPPTRTTSRPLSLDLIQMLWDRGEPNGYAHRMTDRPAAGHARAQGADQRRPRRSPGHQLPGRRRGPDDRRRPASRSSTRVAGRTPKSSGTCPRSPRYPYRRLGGLSTGTSARCAPIPAAPANFIGRRRLPTNTPNRAGEDPHGAPRGARRAATRLRLLQGRS